MLLENLFENLESEGPLVFRSTFDALTAQGSLIFGGPNATSAPQAAPKVLKKCLQKSCEFLAQTNNNNAQILESSGPAQIALKRPNRCGIAVFEDL